MAKVDEKKLELAIDDYMTDVINSKIKHLNKKMRNKAYEGVDIIPRIENVLKCARAEAEILETRISEVLDSEHRYAKE
jgi:hypothetical protein